MSTNNTFAKSFNVNHLKLTPEKLAEWDKRHSANTSLSRGEDTTITSKYFNFSQQNQNQNDNEIPQIHENLQDENQLFESSPPSIDLQIDAQSHESIKTAEDQMKLDNMILDDNSCDQIDDNLKDSENGIYLQEDHFENKNTGNDLEMVEDYDVQELNTKASAQEQDLNLISENDKSKNISEEDSSNFLMTTQNIDPTVE